MVNITYQMALSTIQTVSLVVGIIYYITIMRNAQRNQQHTLETRQAQMFMQIYSQTNDPSFIKAWQVVFKSAHWDSYEEWDIWRSDPENSNAINRIGMFYEGLGVLVKEKYVPIRLIALLMTGMTRHFWEKQAPIVDEARERLHFPRFMSESEYLYDELMKYVEEHPELKT